MKVSLLQFDMAWEQKAANHATVRRLVHENPPEPGSLLVLAEMFATGFSMNLPVTAQTENLEDEAFLADLARETHCAVLGGVVSPREKSGMARNEAVTFSPDGGVLNRYVKLQPFTFAGEEGYHLPGNDVSIFPWAGSTLAAFVCYDIRFPEHFRRASALGAEVLIVIANIPTVRLDHWTTLLKARAIENQAYVLGVNRCGSDPNCDYSGGSLIIDPLGRVLAEAGSAEGIISANLDLAELRAYRQRFPALKDRRDVVN